MKDFKKIKWFRSYNNNDNLKPYDIRTYTTEHFLHISLFFIVLCFFWNTLFNLCHTTNFIWAFKHFFFHKNEYYELAKQKFNFVLYSSLAISTFISLFTVKKHSYSVISEKSKFFFYKDVKQSNFEFHKNQLENKLDGNFKQDEIKTIELITENDCFKNGKRINNYCFPISIKEEIFNLSWLITGQAGSGKSVYFTWFYQSIIRNNHKIIVHSPDDNVLNLFVENGIKSYICAPWLLDGYKLDLFSILQIDDETLLNSLIDSIVISFHGQRTEDFFNEGARAILIAGLRKAVKTTLKNEEILFKWLDVFNSLSSFSDYKILVNTYFIEASNYVSEDAEKMTASILGSMSNTLIKIGKLALFYSNQKKKFDIKNFILDIEDKNREQKQAIIICSNPLYNDISNINTSLIVNLATTFGLSPQRKINFENTNKRIFQVLDEFPNFAKNIDLDFWLKNINEGRKFGFTVAIAMQNTEQTNGFMKKKEQAKEFLAAFANNVIATPSPEEKNYLKTITAPITYDETEFNANFNNGSKSLSKTNKQREDEINPIELAEYLGVRKKGKKAIGVNIAFRMTNTNSLNILFFPFNQKFCEFIENNLIKNNQIKIKNGKKYRVIKINGTKGLQPLFVDFKNIEISAKQKQIELLQNELNNSIKLNNISNIQSIKDKLNTLLQEDKIETETVLETKNIEEVKEEKKEDILGEILEDGLKHSITHSLDHSGVLTAIDTTLDILDDLTTNQNNTNNDTSNIDRTKKIKIKKKGELEND